MKKKNTMWKPERHVLCLVLMTTLALATLASAVEESDHPIRECNPNYVIGPCGNDRRCVEDSSTNKFMCMCKINFFSEIPGGKCVQRPTTTVPPPPETTTQKLNGTLSSSGSTVAVGLLVPTFLIVLGVLGFCAARHYGLLPCRRNLYGNVLVTRDDDDDDPPIAGVRGSRGSTGRQDGRCYETK